MLLLSAEPTVFALTDALTMLPVALTLTATKTADVLLAPTMLPVSATMDLSLWVQTQFATTVFALILTNVTLMPTITLDVWLPLAELTAKLTGAAGLALPMPIAETSMEAEYLTNPDAKPTEPVDLVPLTPIALLEPPIVALTEVATPVLLALLDNNVEPLMEVKYPTSLTVIPRPTNASLIVLLMPTVLMSASLTVI